MRLHGLVFCLTIKAWKHNSELSEVIAWNRGRKDIRGRSIERMEQAPYKYKI